MYVILSHLGAQKALRWLEESITLSFVLLFQHVSQHICRATGMLFEAAVREHWIHSQTPENAFEVVWSCLDGGREGRAVIIEGQRLSQLQTERRNIKSCCSWPMEWSVWHCCQRLLHS